MHRTSYKSEGWGEGEQTSYSEVEIDMGCLFSGSSRNSTPSVLHHWRHVNGKLEVSHTFTLPRSSAGASFLELFNGWGSKLFSRMLSLLPGAKGVSQKCLQNRTVRGLCSWPWDSTIRPQLTTLESDRRQMDFTLRKWRHLNEVPLYEETKTVVLGVSLVHRWHNVHLSGTNSLP